MVSGDILDVPIEELYCSIGTDAHFGFVLSDGMESKA
jgi:hypothetical protein